MTNTNPRYWAWDGTSLETYAHGIEELTEGRSPLPPLRGEDKVIPGARGRLFRPKVPDARVIPLTMWGNGANDAGVIVDEDMWRFSLEGIRNLLWGPIATAGSITHVLSKGVLTNGTGTLVRVHADAYLSGGMDMRVEDGEQGLQIARWNVEFTLPYPYFADDSTGLYL